MKYAKLNAQGEFLEEIQTQGPIEWDADNFCTAHALFTDGKAEQFNVVELEETLAPEHNVLIEYVSRDGAEQVDGVWKYKWQVIARDAGQITALAAEAESQRVASLWQAAHEYEYAQVSGSAIGLLAIGVLQSLPKCLAVQGWIKAIWTEYYTRKATGSTDADFSVAGGCPHSVPELMVELGL